jgi:hypothetical protein
MIEDKNNIIKLLLNDIRIIISEYNNSIEPDTVNYLLTNNLVEYSNANTISFFVRDGILYLPKRIYDLMPIFKGHELYGISPNDGRKPEDYLDTNTTYYDYIDHFIKAGLTPYKYFEESLLHEAMHLCGSLGGNPLDEGINELKTRELAQKYGIKISAYGYPKETEVAKTLQEVIGKDVMDQLAFKKISKRRDFLIEKVGIEKADLYKKVFKDMILLSDEFLKKMETISDPYAKAGEYKKISYAEVLEYIDEYIEKTK